LRLKPVSRAANGRLRRERSVATRTVAVTRTVGTNNFDLVGVLFSHVDVAFAIYNIPTSFRIVRALKLARSFE